MEIWPGAGWNKAEAACPEVEDWRGGMWKNVEERNYLESLLLASLSFV